MHRIAQGWNLRRGGADPEWRNAWYGTHGRHASLASDMRRPVSALQRRSQGVAAVREHHHAGIGKLAVFADV